MNLYIQQLSDGSWGNPTTNESFDSMSKEELKAMNWYQFALALPPFIDVHQNATVNKVIKDGVVHNEWVITLKTGEELKAATKIKWSQVRMQRNDLLKLCDYTQLKDCVLTTEKQNQWVTYRQQLRDITLQADPFNINWPVDPNGITGTVEVNRV